MFPGALSEMKGLIFLRFLPPRNSVSQHFTVLLMRDIERAAVVEKVGRCYSRPALLTGEPIYNWGWRFLCDFFHCLPFLLVTKKIMTFECAFLPHMLV